VRQVFRYPPGEANRAVKEEKKEEWEVGTDRIAELLRFLYGGEAGKRLLPELLGVLEEFQRPGAVKGRGAAGETGGKKAGAPAGKAVTNRDAFLITYGDMLGPAADETKGADGKPESGLARLNRFLSKWNKENFTYLHLLPFHPYSSDDGFSVIDYRAVDSRFGSWEDIEKLGRDFNMVFDFVVNHGSVKSDWFKKFLAGEGKYENWYITRPGDYDYSAVVRPRTHPLLTPFQKDDGSAAYVWTTFSADQADYDFSRPEVLLEFVRIFLDYARRGGRMLRLDAIAYLWKEDGTPCLHHPKTHAVVKLFRAVIEYLGLDMLLLTETNVPHTENISYFGEAGPGFPAGDEARLVYNFALPPLTLYAALSGDAGPLKKWAAGLPALPPGQYYLNFLASHDGVGLTPARGLVDEGAFAAAIQEAQNRGALVSMKSGPQGPVPYELNCSWADMAAPGNSGSPETQARAFLTSYGPALAMPGLPAVYFHSWTGSRAWREGPRLLGFNRAVNREKPAADRVERELEDSGAFRYHVYRGFRRLFRFRRSEDAFSPEFPFRVLESGEHIFAFLRGPDTRGRGVVCIHNFGAEDGRIDLSQLSGKDFGDFCVPPLGKVPVEGRSLLWLAAGGGKKIRECKL
jgi:sucrose phosphorylase